MRRPQKIKPLLRSFTLREVYGRIAAVYHICTKKSREKWKNEKKSREKWKNERIVIDNKKSFVL